MNDLTLVSSDTSTPATRGGVGSHLDSAGRHSNQRRKGRRRRCGKAAARTERLVLLVLRQSLQVHAVQLRQRRLHAGARLLAEEIRMTGRMRGKRRGPESPGSAGGRGGTCAGSASSGWSSIVISGEPRAEYSTCAQNRIQIASADHGQDPIPLHLCAPPLASARA